MNLRVLTLNCWGLPDCITKVVYRRYKDPKLSGGRLWTTRTQRIEAIAKTLNSYDIVCLQEVWIQKDQEALTKICAENGMPYSHVFSSGMIGSSGLQLISRYPIKEVSFHRYRVNGRVLRVDHGDYHAGKGFGYAKLAVSDTQLVNVILTHTIAQYNPMDTYLPDRLSQVWELSRFIQFVSRPDQLLITVGDMNFRVDSLEYNMLTQIGNLSDAYRVINPKTIGKSGSTIMCDLAVDAKPSRIDFVFFKKTKTWELEESVVVLNSQEFLYSDHFGVSAVFRACDPSSSKPSKEKISTTNVSSFGATEEIEKEVDAKVTQTVLQQSATLIQHGAVTAQSRKTSHLVRCLMSALVLYLLLSISAPGIFIASVSIYTVVEFFIAMFVVENEIAALKEAYKEIKYFC